MNRTRWIPKAVPGVMLTALAVVCGTGPEVAAEDQQPLLVLGNHKDHCDSVNPNGSPIHVPLYVVPPNRLEDVPRLPAPVVDTPILPDPAWKSDPKSPPTSEFSEQNSDDRTERLDRLSNLLDELRESLKQSPILQPKADTPPTDPALPSMAAPDAEPSGTEETANTASPPAQLPEMSLPDLPNHSTSEMPPGHEPPGHNHSSHEPPGHNHSGHGHPKERASSVPAPQDPILPEPIDPPSARSIDDTQAVSVVSPPKKDAPPTPEPLSIGTTGEKPATWILNTKVGAPVDRLGLADNLYAADEIKLALDVYAEIDPQTLQGADEHWVRMQLANCYRRLGDIEEAAKLYRKLVTVEDPSWMGGIARWWLKAIDTRTSVLRQSQEMEATLELLKEQINDERES